MISAPSPHDRDIAPALYLRTVGIVRGPQNEHEERLESAYAEAVLRSSTARTLLVEVGAAFAASGLAALAIKGTAHILDLYDGPLPRNLSDLDLVVKPDQGARIRGAQVAGI